MLFLGQEEGGREAEHARGADVTALMLALVRRHLAGGGEGEPAPLANAVKMISGLAVHAALILALLVLVEFLEAVLGICVILDVVALVLLNVTLVLEGEGAPGTSRRRPG